MDFVIRPYRAADFDRLWQIDQECFAPGIAYSQMELSGFITRRNAITLIAEHRPRPGNRSRNEAPDRSGAPTDAAPKTQSNGSNAIVGFAIAHPYKKHGRILTLDILSEARRTGLGTRLLVECEARLRQRRCTEIYLETAVNNEPALKLYHKQGYRILRTLPGYYHATGLDAFLLGKEL